MSVTFPTSTCWQTVRHAKWPNPTPHFHRFQIINHNHASSDWPASLPKKFLKVGGKSKRSSIISARSSRSIKRWLPPTRALTASPRFLIIVAAPHTSLPVRPPKSFAPLDIRLGFNEVFSFKTMTMIDLQVSPW